MAGFARMLVLALSTVSLLSTGAMAAPPVLTDDAFLVDEDTVLTISAPGVFANDGDPEGDAFELASVDETSVQGASVSVGADGALTYTPRPEFSGIDSFTYTATDNLPSGIGEFSLHPTQPPFGGRDTRWTTLGDLDGDGDLDAIVCNVGSGPGAFVWLNDGAGHFAPHPTTPTFAASAIYAAAGDVDSNGTLDIFIVDYVSGVTELWLNDGNAVFSKSSLPTEIGASMQSWIKLADIDGDTDLDVLYAGLGIGVLLNQGAGTFVPHPIAPVLAVRAVDAELADLDGDDDLDLVTINQELGDTARVLVNDGNGVFTPHLVSPTFAPGRMQAVELADLDADGDIDAAFGGNAFSAFFVVYLNNGSGALTPHPSGNAPTTGGATMRSGDLDGDGDIDLTFVYGGLIEVWTNDGAGLFAKHSTFDPARPGPIALGDLDGDLDLDMFISSDNNTNEEVWLNDTEYWPVSLPATVTVTVAPVNDAPLAAADHFSTQEDGTLTVVAPGLLGNDVDVDQDGLSIPNPPTSTQEGGALSLQADGGFVYMPPLDFYGVDQFSYDVIDDSALGPLTTTGVDVIITVAPANDPPAAFADSFSVDEDSSHAVDVLANDIDPDDDPLSILSVTTPAHGTVTDVNRGVITYAPDPDFYGSDAFEYIVVDPTGTTAVGNVVVTVNGLNDAPSFIAPTPETDVSAVEGTEVSFVLVGVDPEDDPLSYAIDGLPAGASFDTATGAFTWTPTWEQAGTWTLTLVVDDGEMEARRQLGIAASYLDADGDGLPDTWEASVGLDPSQRDTDGDLISDGDEVGDDVMAPSDSDGDGTIDALDFDSDGDGVPDHLEAGDQSVDTPPVDSDGDGNADFQDVDADGDGVVDGLDNCATHANATQDDLDGDRMGDACDDDDDADRLVDYVEDSLGLSPRVSDTDGDGILDGDEVTDISQPANTDGDADIDALDTDSDGDGVDDAIEAGDDALGTPPVDTDQDGTPDFRDTDSDNDGVNDGDDVCRLVADVGQEDADSDGIGDACEADMDGDGVVDDHDNCDGVINPDQRDLDEDARGDACDDDKDGDGVLDAADRCPFVANVEQTDLDSDGLGDACDDDVDGDGANNFSDNCPLLPNADQADEDGDGLGDVCDAGVPPGEVSDDGGCGCTLRRAPNKSSSLPWRSMVLVLLVGCSARRLRRPRSSRDERD